MLQDTEISETNGRIPLPRFVLVVSAVAVFFWFCNLLIAILPVLGKAEDRGTFGDTFGVVNSLFTGLAFIGVVWSVYMQREDLQISKTDMRITKGLLARQEENINKQNLATDKQMFENTFFQLFSAFNQLTESLTLLTESELRPNPERGSMGYREPRMGKGKDVFTLLIEELQDLDAQVRQEAVAGYELPKKDPATRDALLLKLSQPSIKRYQIAYQRFFAYYGDDLGRYFRSFYTMLRFVENSTLDQDSKYFYFKLIRAQLSRDESTLIALNTLSQFTTEKFNSILLKYGLAKNADKKSKLLKRYEIYISKGIYGKTFHEGPGNISNRLTPQE